MVWAGIAGGVGQPECPGEAFWRVGWACGNSGGTVDELQRLRPGDTENVSGRWTRRI